MQNSSEKKESTYQQVKRFTDNENVYFEDIATVCLELAQHVDRLKKDNANQDKLITELVRKIISLCGEAPEELKELTRNMVDSHCERND